MTRDGGNELTTLLNLQMGEYKVWGEKEEEKKTAEGLSKHARGDGGLRFGGGAEGT